MHVVDRGQKIWTKIEEMTGLFPSSQGWSLIADVGVIVVEIFVADEMCSQWIIAFGSPVKSFVNTKVYSD